MSEARMPRFPLAATAAGESAPGSSQDNGDSGGVAGGAASTSAEAGADLGLAQHRATLKVQQRTERRLDESSVVFVPVDQVDAESVTVEVCGLQHVLSVQLHVANPEGHAQDSQDMWVAGMYKVAHTFEGLVPDQEYEVTAILTLEGGAKPAPLSLHVRTLTVAEAAQVAAQRSSVLALAIDAMEAQDAAGAGEGKEADASPAEALARAGLRDLSAGLKQVKAALESPGFRLPAAAQLIRRSLCLLEDSSTFLHSSARVLGVASLPSSRGARCPGILLDTPVRFGLILAEMLGGYALNQLALLCKKGREAAERVGHAGLQGAVEVKRDEVIRILQECTALPPHAFDEYSAFLTACSELPLSDAAVGVRTWRGRFGEVAGPRKPCIQGGRRFDWGYPGTVPEKGWVDAFGTGHATEFLRRVGDHPRTFIAMYISGVGAAHQHIRVDDGQYAATVSEPKGFLTPEPTTSESAKRWRRYCKCKERLEEAAAAAAEGKEG